MASVGYYIIAAQVGVLIVFASAARARLQEAFFSHLDIHGRLHQLTGAFAEGLSLGTLPLLTGEIRQEQAQAAAIARVTVLVTDLSWFFCGMTAVFLVFMFFLHRDRFNQLSAKTTRHLIGISSLCLFIGLLAPVMSMSVAPTFPILGRVFLAFKSRTIISAIVALFASGNWFPATLVTLFSVLMPATKIAVAGVALRTGHEKRKSIKNALDAIGKWSMADVFVVALFLACLALNATDPSTSARPLWGFYFFSAYCIISMIVSFALGHIRQEPEKEVPTVRSALPTWADTLVRGVFVVLAVCCTWYGLIYFAMGQKAAAYVTASVTHQSIELQDSVIRLRADSATTVPISFPYSGTANLEARVVRGNPVNVFLITADQIANVRAGRRFVFVNSSRASNSRSYARLVAVDSGSYYLVLRDPSLGVLSAPVSEIKVHVDVSR
jgi:hypothetical protein